MSSPANSSLWQRVFRLVSAEWGTIAFNCVSVLFFIGAFGLRGQAGDFPMAVSTLTVVLGLAVLFVALRDGAQGDLEPGEVDYELGWNLRTALAVGWFGLALAVTYAFGIVFGAAVASLAYFLFLTSVGPTYALVNGLSFSLFIWVVFKKLAGLPLYSGMF
jgi:hypothetical protein